MLGRLAGILAVCVAACFGQDLAADFQKSVMPVLSARCVGCHSAQLKSGNLNLEQFRNASLATQQAAVWRAVRSRFTAGTMPPATAQAPTDGERAAVLAWIEKAAGPSTAGGTDPGRVTARRLNRVEYDNTIRDLLGVAIHAAAEFPLDDSGY